MRDALDKDIILYFRKQLEFDAISDLIHILKDRMKARHVSFVTYKKVLMLMIESLENILRYNKQIDKNAPALLDHPPEFQIYAENECFIIKSSNAILNLDIPGLDERLKYLNLLDKMEIKDLYKSTITDGKFSDKGGAGLGIIEMAKITDEKLIFSFVPINDKFSYFTLQMVVLINENQIKNSDK
jgi:hypothetical protein